MGTALVMEHANALAQMIVSEKDKLFDERVEALVKLYRRAEFYLKQGFLESIVCEFHRKKVEMIMQAETKGEITEILKLSKPHFDGKKFVYTSPYAVEEEELLLWSLTSLQGPLRDEGYRRYRELFFATSSIFSLSALPTIAFFPIFTLSATRARVTTAPSSTSTPGISTLSIIFAPDQFLIIATVVKISCKHGL